MPKTKKNNEQINHTLKTYEAQVNALCQSITDLINAQTHPIKVVLCALVSVYVCAIEANPRALNDGVELLTITRDQMALMNALAADAVVH